MYIGEIDSPGQLDIVQYEYIRAVVIQYTHPSEVHAGEISWVDYLYFSAAALTSNIPSEMRPLGAWKYAVMIERLMGYLFLALFVVVLTKKTIR